MSSVNYGGRSSRKMEQEMNELRTSMATLKLEHEQLREKVMKDRQVKILVDVCGWTIDSARGKSD